MSKRWSVKNSGGRSAAEYEALSCNARAHASRLPRAIAQRDPCIRVYVHTKAYTEKSVEENRAADKLPANPMSPKGCRIQPNDRQAAVYNWKG
mmetsp:Transcript_61818/g.156093  ORF Transcript_61818/g.156093 Transcript_61818/m.156093 type:complete len:93 (-) Transcript_61818:1072-1350(-)